MAGPPLPSRTRVITTPSPATRTAASPAGAPMPGPALSGRVRWSRAAYRVLAWVLAACVVVQVFLAGAAVLSDGSLWAAHATFVHVFELLPIVLGVLAFLGKGTRLLVGLSLLGFLLISIQYAFLAARPSLIAGAHAANALVIFGVAIMLAIAAGRPPLPAGATRGLGWRTG